MKSTWGRKWKIDVHALNLKNINAEKLVKFPISNNKTIIEKVTGRLRQMQEPATSLGVDAVLLVENIALVEFSFLKGKLTFGSKDPNVQDFKLDLIPTT
ncbi:MAG: hypothetical protein ACK4EX_03565 [Thermaurantimonas sp.]|uniref:hypothetical protein n=1 Tax=Thermaurantimonas sp. TaxID=2681568 RepID=UPI00391DF034